MSSAPGLTGTQSGERPERSRNAKAQARHRAKRKAYIEQLEQTVTKLQTAMGFTPEQVAALPPPLAKIRELEQENARLLDENEKLRRLLQDGRSVSTSSLDFGTRPRGLNGAGYDGRCVDRNADYTKRRKLSAEMDGGPVYGLSSDPTAPNDLLSRAPPPPLTIPQQPQHNHYNHSSHTPHSAHPPALPHPSSLSHHSSHSTHPSPHPSNHPHHPHNSPPTSGAGSMFHLHGGAFAMPPSTPSSSTSSPPFSPAQTATAGNSPNSARPLSNHGHYGGNYGAVKVEEDFHNPPSSGGYTLPPFNAVDHLPPPSATDSWYHGSERVMVHR